MSATTFKDKATELLHAKRPFQIAVETERCAPRPVTQAEEIAVRAATVGRRETSFSYPPDLFKLWGDRKRGLVIFR